tara:strand:- start:720 stop:1082 length:363 start_codon:yes stop_codon:yes gene_type:complete
LLNETPLAYINNNVMNKLFLITILISAAWGQVRGKEECTEFGCYKIFTEMDNWIDGTIKKGFGFRPSGYTGYESVPVVNDDIPFASLNAIEKYLRSNSSGAPSNYIKELIELWVPRELAY